MLAARRRSWSAATRSPTPGVAATNRARVVLAASGNTAISARQSVSRNARPDRVFAHRPAQIGIGGPNRRLGSTEIGDPVSPCAVVWWARLRADQAAIAVCLPHIWVARPAVERLIHASTPRAPRAHRSVWRAGRGAAWRAGRGAAWRAGRGAAWRAGHGAA